MALWLIRSGRAGQREQTFLDEGRIYLTWPQFAESALDETTGRDAIREKLANAETWKPGKINNHAGQVFAFVGSMQPGDWIAMPSKFGPYLHFGEIKSELRRQDSSDPRLVHYRKVNWFARDVPRSRFDQDLLYSFGAIMTICQIKRNDAEARIRAMASNDWRSARPDMTTNGQSMGQEDADTPEDAPSDSFDLAQASRDQIARFLKQQFSGHQMQDLVAAVLEAMGYETFVPPQGPDGGVDILAGRGELGFGAPHICVQVKSGDSPLERVVLDQLIGTMQNVNAEFGLLVSWGGFKSTVTRQEANQFFRVRLWDQDSLIDRILEYYDQLNEQIRASIPLVRMWTLAPEEESGE